MLRPRRHDDGHVREDSRSVRSVASFGKDLVESFHVKPVLCNCLSDGIFCYCAFVKVV